MPPHRYIDHFANKPITEARFSGASNRNCAISFNLPQIDQTGVSKPQQTDLCMAIPPSECYDLPARLRSLRLDMYVAAFDKVDLRIEHNHVALLDAIAYFHLRSQVPCY
jgi:hypothetical protein